MDATPTLGYPTTNYVQIPTTVPIYDLRGKENDFNLDKNGFELREYIGNIHNVFDDNSEEQQWYYEDANNALKNHLGAFRVVSFWHVIRFRGPPRPADQCDQTHKNPVYYPHVDSDTPAARAKVLQILGEEEGINPIVNNPLAICDYQSIDAKNDIHSSEVIGSENKISLYIVSRKLENTQKWYYLSNMKLNEIFMIKIFDSDSNVAQFGAHTAFINENASSATIEQCSVEIRCLVFYDE